MKVYKDILGSTINIKKNYQWFSKGENWLVVTRQYSTDIDKLEYECKLISDNFPERRVWCPDELLIKLRREKYIKV